MKATPNVPTPPKQAGITKMDNSLPEESMDTAVSENVRSCQCRFASRYDTISGRGRHDTHRHHCNECRPQSNGHTNKHVSLIDQQLLMLLCSTYLSVCAFVCICRSDKVSSRPPTTRSSKRGRTAANSSKAVSIRK